MRVLVAALALLAALSAGAPTAAADEIRSFDVAIEVAPDGVLDVTETIRIAVDGREITHGINRDFPVQYREADGRTSLATFEVAGIHRNGIQEPYRRSRNGAYVNLRIGSAKVVLPAPSEQTYEIHYRTEGQLRAYDGYDELYWNVTGNEWTFPIDAASVTIRLPTGTPILQQSAYTGPRGASGRDYEVLAAGDGVYRARTTARLGPGAGFTVAVAWPPGVVTVPPVRYGTPGGYAAPMTLGGHRLDFIAAVAATLLGALALLAGWLRVGRDPPAGAIYPRFEPPKGLSPAAVRYIERYGFDRGCLTAAIISMAVKGALKIEETRSASLFRSREYRLRPQGPEAGPLSAGELATYRKLFPGGKALTLKADKTNGAKMDRARAALKSELADEHYGASFRRNGYYIAAGVAAGLICAVLLVGVAARGNPAPVIQWAVAAVLAGLVTHGAAVLWSQIADLRRGVGLSPRRLLRLLPFAVMTIVISIQASIVLGTGLLTALLEPPILSAGAAFGVVAVLFHFLMAAPSKAGRDLLDQIEGFKMYMSAAEEDRLNILNPPEKTPELFERLLPFAVALGLAHEWSERFAAVLATAAAPTWYTGTRRFDIDSLDRHFGSAVSSTTVPSRGSGGSGGGGSSGGGGGGGGGSGW